jgi:hypothetical protein
VPAVARCVAGDSLLNHRRNVRHTTLLCVAVRGGLLAGCRLHGTCITRNAYYRTTTASPAWKLLFRSQSARRRAVNDQPLTYVVLESQKNGCKTPADQHNGSNEPRTGFLNGYYRQWRGDVLLVSIAHSNSDNRVCTMKWIVEDHRL